MLLHDYNFRIIPIEGIYHRHGLEKWSEQVFESVYHDYKAFLAKEMTD